MIRSVRLPRLESLFELAIAHSLSVASHARGAQSDDVLALNGESLSHLRYDTRCGARNLLYVLCIASVITEHQSRVLMTKSRVCSQRLSQQPLNVGPITVNDIHIYPTIIGSSSPTALFYDIASSLIERNS